MKNRSLLAVVAAACLVASPSLAQKSPPENHCTGGEITDIGPLFPAQPNNDFVNASRNCAGIFDCQDFFDITCAGGESVLVTFCQGGGFFEGDPGLRAFNPSDVEIICNDDTCGLGSEIQFTASTPGTYTVRLDSFSDVGYPYTIAVNAPPTCDIVGAVPVELQAIDVE